MRRWIAHFGLFLVAATRSAGAAELTDVASSFEEGHPFEARLRVDYAREEQRGSIKREWELAGQEELVVARDLRFARSRDILTLRSEVGLFRDLALYVELPIVLRDEGEFRFDQTASPCVFPAPGMTATCVNADNSPTTIDGILPRGGFDAQASSAGSAVGFPADSTLAFRGAKRGGSGLAAFDTVNFGLVWAPLSQRRDATKPTWLLGFEGRISFGEVMKFDRAAPGANRGVSDGLHRLHFRTTISKRVRFVEPYVGFWYMLPIARGGSLFVDYGPAQKSQQPQQTAGTLFGLEAIAWERPAKHLKLAIDLRGRIEGKFEGRGYSEAWELFASSPALGCDPLWNPACDSTQTSNAYQGRPFTGLTTIESHARLGADAAIVLQAGRYVRLQMGAQYMRDQSHFIAVDDVGRAFDATAGDGCSFPTTGRVARACEFNPAYRPAISQVGHRYRVDNLDNWRFGLWTQVMY